MKDILYLKVLLWGEEIGRICWDATRRTTQFDFNPDFIENNADLSAVSFSLNGRDGRLPVYSESDAARYKDLPAFLADSLPDSWGSMLFGQWVEAQGIPKAKVTPLQKLAYIGRRGMGALEFVPEIVVSPWKGAIDVAALAQLAEKVAAERDTLMIASSEQPTMEALRQLGTPPGGRMEKILIDIDDETGNILSGQVGHAHCGHYLLKFGDRDFTSAEVEQTYSELARLAGIDIAESRLMPIDGINHFLTRRFDRADGRKHHTQTMAAMSPGIASYEEAINLLRRMGLPEASCQEMFRRMVFNIMANNTDDHDRNFSFIREQDSEWRLAPAYDVTYIINREGRHNPNPHHVMTMGGKSTGFTRDDVLRFARNNDIRSAERIIRKVAEALSQFRTVATRNGVRPFWVGRIEDTIHGHLVAMGERDQPEAVSFVSTSGQRVENAGITAETNGAYRLTAHVDGQEHRYFVQRNTPLNHDLSAKGITNLSREETAALFEETMLKNISNH